MTLKSSPIDHLSRRGALAAALTAVLFAAACSPVTLVQRAVEDRSMEDIADDNKIVVAVNKLMAKYETISVSTEVYEQHLLVYGIMDDKTMFDGFNAEVAKIAGVKKLYNRVIHMTEAEQEAQENNMLGFAEGLKVKAKIEIDWLDMPGLESLNFRIAVDPMGIAYVLGRAKSPAERDRALAVAGNAEGVKRVRDYTFIR
ncbi:MAG: BON domain-containing protein [Alphaproteobacteria bacterium]